MSLCKIWQISSCTVTDENDNFSSNDEKNAEKEVVQCEGQCEECSTQINRWYLANLVKTSI